MNILKAMNGMHAEQCLLERLQHLCIQKYAKYETLALSQVDVQLGDKEGEAGQHLSCTISGALKGTVKSSKNLQLQNLLLQRCESASLPVPPPSPGVSSLPRDALQRSVGGATGSARLAGFLSKLERNETVRVVAIGASNTAMFAESCSGGGGRKACTVESHTDAATLATRLAERARKLGKVPGADWLARLLRVIHARYPGAPLIFRTIGYGGMGPRTVASCTADFFDVGSPVGSGPSSPESRRADLAIVDFAIFGGLVPFAQDWHAFETLLRSIWSSGTAIVLLNYANWCRGGSGLLEKATLGHARCQSMLFNRSAARVNLRAALVPDPWELLLGRLAAYYGHGAVSVFHSLQPLATSGAIDAVDFTHDGKHPVYWPQVPQVI